MRYDMDSNDKTISPVRPHLWLISWIGVIVPRRLRADWRQEWEAELRHRELLLADWDKLNRRTKLDLLRRSLGAFWDALVLQPQRLEEEMFQDLRYGARMLLKTPGFTLTAAFTLALGIGASTTIFSAVNPILFESLPYPSADRLVIISDHGPGGARQDVTFGTYRELVERGHFFDGLAVMRGWQPTLTGLAGPERLDGQRVSAKYFETLGVSPTFGRGFDSADDRPGGSRVTIISNALWQRRYGGDHTIIGQQITLDDASYSVIGVMPASFENILAPSAGVWTLLQYDSSLPSFESREWGHHLRMVGRLQSGIKKDQAARELGAIASTPVPEFSRPPWATFNQGLIVDSLKDETTRAVKPALLVILGAVILVLVISCVNVTNLLLARGARRRGEFAVRAALGAPRTRLVRQLLTESLLLALLGGVLGMIVADFGIRALVALSPPGLPRVTEMGLNQTVLFFGMAITTLVGVMVGFVPARHASRSDLTTALQQGSQRTTGGHQLTRRILVVAEVALALVLLVSAGLMLRSLQRLFAVDPGFNASHLLTMQVQVSGRRFDDVTRNRYFKEVLDAVGRVPGVTATGFSSQLPLSDDRDEYGAHFEFDEANAGYSAFRYAVTPGYFELMGIPLHHGRLLNEQDKADAPLAVVISESLAQRKFRDQDPLGKRVQIGPADGTWHTIVGVVGNIKQASLSASESDALYTTPEQWRFADNVMSLVVRARDNAAALAPNIRQAIWSVDKDQPIVRVATMDDLLARSASERRFVLILLETFGLVALVLAATGIYGVLSGSVTERTREIGVRLALGAQRADVLALILRDGVKLTLGGVGIGLLGAWAATGLLTKLLYDVSSTDPWSFGGVALMLTIVALLACYLPARRATKVDPLVALRHE
jgi:putative ABC transport system permease protein